VIDSRDKIIEIVRSIVTAAVDEERRGSVHTTAHATDEIFMY
jgi:hypothetical protein